MKTNRFIVHSLLCFVLLTVCCFTSMPCAYSQWAKSIGGSKADYGQNITTDVNGNVYVIGDFSGKADVDPGPGTYYLTSSCPCDESDPLKPDVFFAKYSKAGALIWARKVSGTGNDNGKDIAVDTSGNVYITGTFELTADFDPGAGTRKLTSNGGQDIFLAKYNKNGELTWANNIGGAYYDYGNSLSVSSAGIITLAGAFAGNVDFDPTSGSLFKDAGSSTDPFFARYNTNGKPVWVKDMAGNGEASAESIFVDAAGAIYLTGSFYGTSDFDPGTGTRALTGIDAKDPFYAKYSSAGNLTWATSVAGYGDQTGQSIAADASGNAYITGYFIGTVDFNPGAATYTLSSPGTFNAYLLKLNKSGTFAWVKNIGGSLDDIGLSVVVDPKQNIYATGYFAGTAAFDSATTLTSTGGSTDIYVATYNSSGKLLMVQKNGGSSDDWASAITTDGKGFLYLTGYYTGTSSFSVGSSTTILTSAGNADVYLLKCKTFVSTSGTYIPPTPVAAAKQSAPVNTSNSITITVSPNPAADFITIKAPAFADKVSLQVYDASGKMVIAQQATNLYQSKLNIKALSRGVYILRITGDNGRNASATWIKE